MDSLPERAMFSETLAWPNIEEALTSYSEDPAPPITEEAPPPAQSKIPIPKHEFVGHEDDVQSSVFLHDNLHIVSGSLDGTICKWNRDTGLLVGKPWKGNGGWILAMALSPDGKTIACGRKDGSVQQWNTDGQIIEGRSVWTGHSGNVWALSWSPSGEHIASGSGDGTILIRTVENGETEVDLITIKSEQEGVFALAYSPSGDRIASGGLKGTICIWDADGKLAVGPIRRLGLNVKSVVWSPDSTKLYSAEDEFARIFDSNTGKELYRFKHDHYLHSVALSPKHNVLACVGKQGIAQLWDAESHQPIGQPFTQEDCKEIDHVSFSQDGRYLAYGGEDKKLTLWMLKEIVPELQSPTPSYFEAEATNPYVQSGGDDYRDDFFQSHHRSGPSGPSRPHPSLARRTWNFFTSSPASEPIALQQRPKRSLFVRRTAPQPVTVAATRKNRIYVALLPWKTNTQAGRSSSAAAHSAAQPSSTDQSPPQSQPQVQTVTQHLTQQEDHGCWGNFCLALGCIPRRTRTVVSVDQSSSAAAQPAMQPFPIPQSHPQSRPQVQTVTQQPTQDDYGCWGNFCLALWCIQRRTRIIVSAAQPSASES